MNEYDFATLPSTVEHAPPHSSFARLLLPPHNKNTCLIVMGQAEQFLARRCDFSFGHRRADSRPPSSPSPSPSPHPHPSLCPSVSLFVSVSVSSCRLRLGATVVSTSAKAAKAKKATRAACNCKSAHTDRDGWTQRRKGRRREVPALAGPVERCTTHRLRSVAFIKNFV